MWRGDARVGTSPPVEPFIRFSRIRKAFGPKVIYNGLDLNVFKGETLVIVGGSGVGKSVMLKMLIRLLEPDSGSITYHGEEVTKMDEERLRYLRQNIAMLFQGAALFDSISVGENVAYALWEHFRESMNAKEIAERVDWALSSVDLPGIEEMRPADLSGGMRKRVGLARAIALQPEVILYDEPTTGLDPVNVERINRLINNLKNNLNVTSIAVTHDMGSAFAIGDRMAMVHSERIIFAGTPEEIRNADDERVTDFIEGNVPEFEDVETLLNA